MKTTKMEYSKEINKAEEKILLLGEKISSIFKCDNCGQVFSDESGLQRHIKLIHTLNKYNRREDKKVKCKECGKPFFTKDDMQRHIISKHRVTISKEAFLKKTKWVTTAYKYAEDGNLWQNPDIKRKRVGTEG